MKLTGILILLSQSAWLSAQEVLYRLPVDSLVGDRFQWIWSFENDDIPYHDPEGTTLQLFDCRETEEALEGPVRTWRRAEDCSKHDFFPDASLCYTQQELSREAFFGFDADSNLVRLGSYYFDAGTEVFDYALNPGIVEMPSAALGESYTDTTLTLYVIDGDSSLYHGAFQVSFIAIGSTWTPEGLYAGCLIQRESELDTLGNIHRNTYNYYHQNLSNVVLSVTMGNYPTEEILYLFYPGEVSGPVSVAPVRWTIEKIRLSQDALMLELNTQQSLHLMLYDLAGKLVFSSEISVDGQAHIPLHQTLAQGGYLLVLVDAEGNFRAEKLWTR
jgi:hypothetical protein